MKAMKLVKKLSILAGVITVCSCSQNVFAMETQTNVVTSSNKEGLTPKRALEKYIRNTHLPTKMEESLDEILEIKSEEGYYRDILEQIIGYFISDMATPVLKKHYEKCKRYIGEKFEIEIDKKIECAIKKIKSQITPIIINAFSQEKIQKNSEGLLETKLFPRISVKLRVALKNYLKNELEEITQIYGKEIWDTFTNMRNNKKDERTLKAEAEAEARKKTNILLEEYDDNNNNTEIGRLNKTKEKEKEIEREVEINLERSFKMEMKRDFEEIEREINRNFETEMEREIKINEIKKRIKRDTERRIEIEIEEIEGEKDVKKRIEKNVKKRMEKKIERKIEEIEDKKNIKEEYQKYINDSKESLVNSLNEIILDNIKSKDSTFNNEKEYVKYKKIVKCVIKEVVRRFLITKPRVEKEIEEVLLNYQKDNL